MKKFENNEIFINRIKAYPKVRIFTYSGSMYVNNSNEASITLNNFLNTPVVLSEEEPAGAISSESGDVMLTEDGDYIIIE